MASLAVKLSDELLERLETTAKRRRRTKSALVREAIERLLDDADPARGSALAAARELAGVIKRGPRDLSTNARHMKGFGR